MRTSGATARGHASHWGCCRSPDGADIASDSGPIPVSGGPDDSRRSAYDRLYYSVENGVGAGGTGQTERVDAQDQYLGSGEADTVVGDPAEEQVDGRSGP